MGQIKTLAVWLGIGAALLPFLLLTAFNHPFFDDYRNAYWLREHGAWGVQSWLYHTWTGRFTSTFLMTVLNPVTYGWLGGVKLATAVFFLAQWGSMAWLWRTLARVAWGRACSWGAALAPAGLMLALACNALPAPFSFLYWFAGALVYQVPHIALLCFVALAVRVGWEPARRPLAAAVLAGICLVLAVVGNELLLVQAIVVLAALGLTLPRPARRYWWAWAGVTVVGAAIALSAPGNWVRADAMAPADPPLHRLLLLLPRTALAWLRLLANPVVTGSLVAALLLGLPLGQQATPAIQPLTKRQWWAVGLLFGALNASGCFLFVVLIGAPLARALNEILLVALFSTTLLGGLLGQHLARPLGRRPWAGLLPALVLVLFVSGHVRRAWTELATTAPAYDAQLQARYATLRAARAAGATRATVPALHLRHGWVLAPLARCGPVTDFDIDLTPGCEGTINEVLAQYFELEKVCCTADTGAGPGPMRR